MDSVKCFGKIYKSDDGLKVEFFSTIYYSSQCYYLADGSSAFPESILVNPEFAVNFRSYSV